MDPCLPIRTPGNAGTDLELRALDRSEFPLLMRWLAAPHVGRWFRRPADAAAVEAKYGPRVDGTAPIRMCLILVAGEPVGLIQGYRLADYPIWAGALGLDEPNAGGIDYLIGEPEMCGRGVGSAAIRAFTARLFDADPQLSAVVAVPQCDNVASRRALEKAGYSLVDERRVDSDDPADVGPSAIYSARRPSGRRYAWMEDARSPLGRLSPAAGSAGRPRRGPPVRPRSATPGRSP